MIPKESKNSRPRVSGSTTRTGYMLRSFGGGCVLLAVLMFFFSGFREKLIIAIPLAAVGAAAYLLAGYTERLRRRKIQVDENGNAKRVIR